MRLFSFIITAAALAGPCLAAPPEPLHPATLQTKCANANLGFAVAKQIDACNALLAAPDMPVADRVGTLMQLGDAYLRSMQYERALSTFNAAIRLSPQSGAAFGGRGKAYHARDEYYQAIADFDYALKLDQSLDLYADRGAALVKVGKPEDAAADFTRALARRPDNAPLLAQRGVEYFKAGNPGQAEADLERALALEPDLASHPVYGPFIAEFVRPKRR
jgi:tetratricopeptide (TPR) repeat protein